ncbi:MAG: LysE family translocator [Neisseria sp.]|nr:LysE family translocator [Neisseria sp.]
MQEMIAVALITILAVVSPGRDFAMVTRNSYLYGRRAGWWTAAGIAAAVWIHVGYTLLGVSVLLLKFPALFHGVKLLGALYLVYIGWQTFRHKPVNADLGEAAARLGDAAAFKNGFVTNALNPKTTLFVLSTFTQIVQPQTPLWLQTAYGAFMSLAHLLWFAFVAAVLPSPAIRNRLLQKQQFVNRIIGVLLALLGVLLMVSSLNG